MKRIRINNDFTFAWAIERNGVAENLQVAVNRKLYLRISTGERLEVSEYTIAGNIISVEVTPELAPKVGRYNFIFQYELPDLGLSDAERLCEVDTDAFIIVPRTAEADDSQDLLVTSDMAIGFKGDPFTYDDFTPEQLESLKVKGDPFVYDDFTPEQLESLKGEKGDPFTYDDFTPEQIEALKVKGDAFEYSDFTPEQIALLQKPASDIATTVSNAEQLRVTAETNRNNAEGLRLSAETTRGENETDRIEAEGLRAGAETGRQTAEGLRQQAELNRQTNTATAIQNAETATTNASNAAILANEKAGLANDAALLANEKAELAETATTQANTARDGANSAAQTATNLVNSYATDLAAKANKVQEAWITPTLQNGWVNATNNEIQYFKDNFGFVHLRGTASGGTLTATVFTFPVGYRPARNYGANTSSGLGTNGYMNILQSGVVWFRAGASNNVDNITFKAEQ